MRRAGLVLAAVFLSGCGASLAPVIGDDVGGPELITGTEAMIKPAKVKPPYVSFTSGGLTLDRADWNKGLADRLRAILKKRGVDVMDGPDLTLSLNGFEHRAERIDAGAQRHTAMIEVEAKIGKYAKSHTGNATSDASAKDAIAQAAAQALTKLIEDARFRLALTRP